MKRDAWYAVIAALGLCSFAGLYGLWNAPELANPSLAAQKSKLTASLPSPPKFEIDGEILSTAQEILRLRDPFVEHEGSDDDEGRALNLPKLAPPVRFSEPGEQTVGAQPEPRTVANQQTAASAAPAALQPQPQRQRGSLTLRGVFPSATGGRALVAMPDGSIINVAVGGVVGGWRVLDIRQGAIRLGRGQRTILLAMPR